MQQRLGRFRALCRPGAALAALEARLTFQEQEQRLLPLVVPRRLLRVECRRETLQLCDACQPRQQARPSSSKRWQMRGQQRGQHEELLQRCRPAQRSSGIRGRRRGQPSHCHKCCFPPGCQPGLKVLTGRAREPPQTQKQLTGSALLGPLDVLVQQLRLQTRPRMCTPFVMSDSRLDQMAGVLLVTSSSSCSRAC